MSQMKYDQPLVSVVVLVYNHEKYIADALDGILMQKVDFEYEIVLGEDCSTDKSREIVLRYAQRHPEKFKLLLHESNIGANANQRTILSACTGKFIAFCEGDDYWTDPLKLQKQVNILIEHPDTIICGARAKTWNENNKEFTFITPTLDKDISCMTPKQFFYLGAWVKTCTRMAPREMMLSIPSNYGMDYNQVHYLLAKNPSGTFRCLDEIVAVYREHAGGVFSGADPIDVQKEYFESTRLIARLFDDERKFKMRQRALQTAKVLCFTSSLKLRERVFYAFQYFVLAFSNFLYLRSCLKS